jgi:hypothetical protein
MCLDKLDGASSYARHFLRHRTRQTMLCAVDSNELVRHAGWRPSIRKALAVRAQLIIVALTSHPFTRLDRAQGNLSSLLFLNPAKDASAGYRRCRLAAEERQALERADQRAGGLAGVKAW